MLFKWFDTSTVDRFTDSTVNLFVSRFPPTEFERAGKRQEERFRKVHAAMALELNRFRQHNRLNIYLKARLATRFKWALKEAGYPDKFVDELAYEIAALAAQPR